MRQGPLQQNKSHKKKRLQAPTFAEYPAWTLPIAVKSFLIVTSRRIFLERRKSASSPPRIMQTQPNRNGRADKIPLWRLEIVSPSSPSTSPLWPQLILNEWSGSMALHFTHIAFSAN